MPEFTEAYQDMHDEHYADLARILLFKSLIPVKKRLLHNFFRVGFVADDPNRHSKHSSTVGADKRTIGVLVAAKDGLNDRVIVSLHSAF